MSKKIILLINPPWDFMSFHSLSSAGPLWVKTLFLCKGCKEHCSPVAWYKCRLFYSGLCFCFMQAICLACIKLCAFCLFFLQDGQCPAGNTVKCKPWPFAIVKESLFSSPLKVCHWLRNQFSQCSQCLALLSCCRITKTRQNCYPQLDIHFDI